MGVVPSTKAVGGGISVVCLTRTSRYRSKRRSWLAPLLPTVNAAKLTFCVLEIEHLGYILTRDGIKSQSNKVQAILAIKPPTGVRQLRHFLGMVRYYCDLWARRSNMLAPLTSLIGECGQTKSTKAKGIKKVPWH
jgi:hypothetical protein